MAPDPELAHLAAAAAEGDGWATAELVRRTQPAVWRLVALLGTPGEEEDLVQETYLRALPALARFRGEASVQTWLLRIARNVCADDVRRRVRRRRLVDRLIATSPGTDVEPASEPVDDLLAMLSPDRREAFVLTQHLGLSYEEAAEIQGCPVGTIRSRVARARADLMDAVRRAQAQ